MEVLSKKCESGIGKFIDATLKLPAWAEPFDGMLGTQLVRFLDSKYGVLIPEQYVVLFKGVNTVFENYDDTGVLNVEGLVSAEDLATLVNALIDIPALTEEEEAILWLGIFTGILQVLKTYVLKGKK